MNPTYTIKSRARSLLLLEQVSTRQLTKVVQLRPIRARSAFAQREFVLVQVRHCPALSRPEEVLKTHNRQYRASARCNFLAAQSCSQHCLS